MMQRRIFTFVLAVVLFVGANVVVQTLTKGVHVDMTAEKLYTLSGGTKTLLKSLEKPVRLKFFYARDLANGMPAIQSYAARVEGILRRYESLSGGRVDVEIINPLPFSEEEDQALDYGVQAIPLSVHGENLYFGVVAVIDLGDQKEDFKAIKFFDPGREAFLEQDLTKLVYDLGKVGKPTIGLISPFRMQTQDYIDIPSVGGVDPERWTIINQIRYNYDIEYLDKDTAVLPEDMDVLMLVHPLGLNEATVGAIEDYLDSGGKALFFFDPFSERAAVGKKTSDLNSLLAKWGVLMPKDEIIADRKQGVRVQFQSFDTRLSAIDKLNWPAISAAQMNADDPITQNLSVVRLASPGHFVVEDGADWTPLLTSTNVAMTVAGDDVEKPEKVIEGFTPSGDVYTYAGRLGENIIVVADSDLLRDEFWVQRRNFYGGTLMSQVADNGAFIINALDSLTGNQELINLRSRNPVARPFTVVTKLRRAAEERFLAEEKRLQKTLRTLQDDLSRAQGTDGKAADQAIEQYRADILKTRKALRAVQHDLRKEIEGLGTLLKLLNIGLMPLLVFLLAFVLPKRLGVKRR